MKKSILLLIVLLVAVTIVPVSAQDDPVSCTPEEFAEATSEIDDSVSEFLEMMETAEEATASELTAAAFLVDAYAYGFREGFLEALEEGLCVELEWFGYNASLVLDDLLITTQLSALTVYEAEAGNEELATALLDFVADRAAMLEANATYVEEVMAAVAEGEEVDLGFVECTTEELDATYEGLAEIATTYEEFGAIAEEVEGEELSELIVGYAALASGYWAEFMPVVPACMEAQEEAFAAGLILDESLIIVTSMRLAELEAEMGDADVALGLLESAGTRLEDLMTVLEEME